VPLHPTQWRRTLLIAAFGIALLVLLPWAVGYIERGSILPSQPHEAVARGLTLLLGLWVLALLRREQRITRRHLEDLERLTLADPLTGLRNQRALERDLELALRRSRRLGEPLTLIYLDVDDLKLVNDRFGHAAGDDTLRAVGAVLRSCSRLGTDTAYRVGGDEFVLTVVTDEIGARQLAERFAHAFRARSPYGSTLSTGQVAWDGEATAAELMARADHEMYRNKHMGPRPPQPRAVKMPAAEDRLAVWQPPRAESDTERREVL
jgi:diguanylate cyclase (GGDEF)-like protein